MALRTGELDDDLGGMFARAGGAETVEARAVAHAIERSLFAVPLTAPLAVGRYLLHRRIGSGAAGVVFAGWDPELDRRVAVKLLRADLGGSSTAARYLGEGRTLARLNHPNVVTVFDVGTYDRSAETHTADVPAQGVYLVMELVDGEDLRSFMSRGPHPWRVVVQRFVFAARGLAAAHAAGIVHRDFKPANVLVRRDGGVVVADFGLARPREAVPERASVVEGTLAYMAPEQHRGEPATERSDQFAFCVALFEALCGHRPFDGDAQALLRAKQGGAVPAMAGSVAVPKRVREAVLRGLDPLPGNRHASMNRLLRILERALDRRRWTIATGLVAAGIFIGAAPLLGAMSAAKDGCPDRELRLGEVWNDDVRANGRARFLAAHPRLGELAWAQTDAHLEAWFDRWFQASHRICNGRTTVPPLFTRARERCLEGRLRSARALLALLPEADASTVERAPGAAAALDDPGACEIVDENEQWAGSPSALDDDIARAKALIGAGRLAEGRAAAQRIVQRAQALLDARAESLGHALDAVAAREGAAPPGEVLDATMEAIAAAERADDPSLVDELMVRLVAVLAMDMPDRAAAQRVAKQVEARLLARPNATRRAELDYNLGVLAIRDRKPTEAKASFEAALRRGEPGAPTSNLAQALRVHSGLGAALHEIGEEEAARNHLERSLELSVQIHGADHPYVATALMNLSRVHAATGELDAAVHTARRALAIQERAHGPDGPGTAAAAIAYATASTHAGDLETAVEQYQRADRSILARGQDAAHERVVPLVSLASLYCALGRGEEAIDLLETAAPLLRDGDLVAATAVRAVRVDAWRSTGRLDEAWAELQALAGDPDTQLLGHNRHEMVRIEGELLLDMGRPEEAARVLRPAVAELTTDARATTSPLVQANLRFALARAIADVEPDHARELAALARQTYAELGSKTASVVDDWSKAQGR